MNRLIILLATLLLGACAAVAPRYSPSIPNIQTLDAIQPVKLGQFSVANPSLETISIRSNNMTSSVGGSYGEYLKAALSQDLLLAKKLDANSGTEIDAMLLSHDLDAGAMGAAKATIKAEFVVKRNNVEAYRKQVSAELDWESSFGGMVAIPAAAQNYPILVQNLFAKLFADQDFIAATK